MKNLPPSLREELPLQRKPPRGKRAICLLLSFHSVQMLPWTMMMMMGASGLPVCPMSDLEPWHKESLAVIFAWNWYYNLRSVRRSGWLVGWLARVQLIVAKVQCRQRSCSPVAGHVRALTWKLTDLMQMQRGRRGSYVIVINYHRLGAGCFYWTTAEGYCFYMPYRGPAPSATPWSIPICA